MTCTRGRLAPGSRDLRTARNTFYCYAVPFVWISSPEQQQAGASLWISPATRIPPQSVDPAVKNYHWLDMELALLEAYEHQAQLVVLRDLSGAITEGPGLQCVRARRRAVADPGRRYPAGHHPALSHRAGRRGRPAAGRGRLTAGDLRQAGEVLVSSTAGGIMPVTLVDGQPVGSGVPGPLTLALRERYWARHADPQYSVPVRYDGPG